MARKQRRSGKWLRVSATVPPGLFDRFRRLAHRTGYTRATLGRRVIASATETLEALVLEWGEGAVEALLRSGKFRFAVMDDRGPGEDPALALAFRVAEEEGVPLNWFDPDALPRVPATHP